MPSGSTACETLRPQDPLVLCGGTTSRRMYFFHSDTCDISYVVPSVPSITQGSDQKPIHFRRMASIERVDELSERHTESQRPGAV